MTGDEIRENFRRETRKSFFKPERPVVDQELDVATQATRITRRQRASRIISGRTPDGKTYVLYKRRNPSMA